MTELVAGTQSPAGLRTAGIRARLALEAGRMISWEWDVAADEVVADQGFFDLFGLRPAALTSGDVFAAMHPDDLAAVKAEVEAALERDEDYAAEFRVLLRDGSYRWVGARGAVTARAPDGTPLRMLGINWDKTDQKLQEERLSMMADEMNHRVENGFAIMGALVQIGARTDDDKARYAERLRGQVQALAAAHRLSAEAIRQPATDTALVAVGDVLQAALAAWTAPDGEASQVTLALRRSASLRPQQSGALAMLTYELATNAVKYGALSGPEGHLTVTVDEAPNGAATLRWVERGPKPTENTARPAEPCTASGQSGFGSVLIDYCSRMLRGAVVRTLTPTGLRLEVTFPVVEDAETALREAVLTMTSQNGDGRKGGPAQATLRRAG